MGFYVAVAKLVLRWRNWSCGSEIGHAVVELGIAWANAGLLPRKHPNARVTEVRCSELGVVWANGVLMPTKCPNQGPWRQLEIKIMLTFAIKRHIIIKHNYKET